MYVFGVCVHLVTIVAKTIKIRCAIVRMGFACSTCAKYTIVLAVCVFDMFSPMQLKHALTPFVNAPCRYVGRRPSPNIEPPIVQLVLIANADGKYCARFKQQSCGNPHTLNPDKLHYSQSDTMQAFETVVRHDNIFAWQMCALSRESTFV